MAAKKDAPAEDVADEEAGIVPKGDSADGADESDGYPEASDTGEDHAADHAAPDSVGDAVDADVISDDPAAPPLPITPATPMAAAQNRALYEDQINADARAFAAAAEAAYIDAAVNGNTVEIVTHEAEGE